MGRIYILRGLKPCSIKTFSLVALAALVFSSFLLSTSASAGSFSIRAMAGVAHLPLSDWSNFIESTANPHYYQKNNPNPLYALSVHYKFTPHHSVSLGSELVRASASMGFLMYQTDGTGDTIGSWFSTVKWKFRGIPISLGYEVSPFSVSETFSPYLGAGASIFFSKVEGEVIDSFFSYKAKRTGTGYGLHGTIGFQSRLSSSVSTIWQARYRYSNGMAFTDNEGDIKVEFTGFDFSVGLGLNF
ncbi:MAG TPA: outer membrane beta-barrel protein [Verrucomicrobiae bacterium]|nr:outer membrane beta-barrel protein [Verrucomicrobiae bacterium]